MARMTALGKKAHEIAVAFDCHPDTVRSALKRLQIPAVADGPRRSLSVEQRADALRMKAEGSKTHEIAVKFGCHQNTIGNLLKKVAQEPGSVAA